MTRRREVGCCYVFTATNGTWLLPRDQYTRVRQAWLKGAPFVDTFGLHGEPLTIKLGTVDGISNCASEHILASLDESRADTADDSLAGGPA